MNLDDIITYSVSLLWLVIIIGFLIAIFNELREQRRLKNLPQVDQPSLHPSLRRSLIPHSYSVSSLSHVYTQNGILQVRFGNPHVVHLNTSDRDWSSPSAFIDRPLPQATMVDNIPDYPSFFGLTAAQVERAAPSKLHVTEPTEETLLCVICMDDVQQGHCKRDLPCGHAFHAKCILTWLKKANRCPCCSADVVPRDAISNFADILRIEEAEFLHFSGLRELRRSDLEERREHSPRHNGLSSFPNRRATPPQRMPRGYLNDRGLASAQRAMIQVDESPYDQFYPHAVPRNDEELPVNHTIGAGGEIIMHVEEVNLDHLDLESEA